MRSIAAPLLLAAGLLAACAAPSAPSSGTSVAGVAGCGEARAVPAFLRDGSVRRDLETGAPVFLAPRGQVAARAPRFHSDGSVSRDPETGAPVYEEVRGGIVARVLVVLPR